MNEFEDRVSAALKSEPDRVPSGSWERNQQLLRRRSAPRAAMVWIAAAAVVVLAVGVAALVVGTRQPDSAGPPTAAVPSVVGLSQDEAVAKLREAGYAVDLTILAVEVEDDSQVGKVVMQDPAAGVGEPTANPVRLSIGKARSLVAVPNVIGMSAEEAKKAIEAAALVYAVSEANGDEDYKGRAQAQDPQQGDVRPGSTVTVTIGLGSGSIAVPNWDNYDGRPYQEVEAELTALGWQVKSQATNSPAGVEQVVSVEGAGVEVGPTVPKGTVITLFYSDNSQFLVPDLRGLTNDEANTKLIEAGSTTGAGEAAIPVESTNVAEIGKVISQTPEPGTAYPKVGAVTLNIGVAKQVTVAPLVGRTVDQATADMAANGWQGRFNVTTITTADTALVGSIAASDPATGSLIAFNARVTISVYVLG